MLQEFLQYITQNRPFLENSIRGIPGVAARIALLPEIARYSIERSHRSGPLRVLEIGSWVGSSALAWIEGIRRYGRGDGVVFCVDLWHKSHNPLDEPLRGIGYEVFRHNITSAGADEMVVPIMADSRTALAALAPGFFDIIFVDGFHGYSIAYEDIANAKRLVADGGIICGDDLELQLHECNREAAIRYRNHDDGDDPDTGLPYHPGVTLAVHDHFGEVVPHLGLWALEKFGDQYVDLPLAEFQAVIPEFFPTQKAREAARDLNAADRPQVAL